jgi:hypothetical protein
MENTTPVDLDGKIGGTLDTTFTLFSDDDETQVFPLGDWTWELFVDLLASSPYISGSGLTIDDDAGTIALRIPPSDTSTLQECRAHFYLQQTRTADPTEVYYPVNGTITWEMP